MQVSIVGKQRGRQQHQNNSEVINDYLTAMQTETNLSSHYRRVNTILLGSLSRFHKDKPFTNMTRENVLSYLNSFRKTDKDDPLHKWIGTYNFYLICLSRFFKWLEHPELEPRQRPKPSAVQNIPKLRRKEVSIYKPTDLWTLEDDLVFLKWCPNKRNRCHHAISRDLSARPNEILTLKNNDIMFKTVDNGKQYAEVLVNGKTGTRHLPLIDSLPYIKEWLDQHPQRNNPEAYFICSMDRKKVGKQMTVIGLYGAYAIYRDRFFPRLLKDPTVPNEDKHKIQQLLKKPWNLYIRRHSSLTAKSKFLHGSIFNQHAGWSPRSNMHLKYVHYFDNESSESILQEYGILPKDNQKVDLLKPKQCPNCNEFNRPDQKFCVKCRMVLVYDAYNETLEKQQEKESEVQKLIKKQEQDMKSMREEMENKFQQILAKVNLASLK